MTSPHLQWTDRKGREKIFWLSADEVLIGRHSEADLILSDPFVSRQHARVSKEGEAYFLIDLDSTHGTFVNGRKVNRHKLVSGDRIGLGRGRTQLVFGAGEVQPGSIEVTWDTSVENSILELAAAIPGYADYSDLEKLSLLLDFQYTLGQNFSPQGTFQQILASALKLSGAERGFILLREENEFQYVVGMDSSGQSLLQSEFVQASQTVVHQVATSGEAVFMTEGIEGDLARQDSIIAMKLRALSCVPLRWFGEDAEALSVRGILYLDSTKTMHALSGLDQKILDRLADEAASVFEKVELIESFEERRRIEQELALAQETQQQLLPLELPDHPNYCILAYSQPTRHVGGDFYDFFDYSDAHLSGALADVSGKGISAALLSALTQGALSAELHPGVDPGESLNRVNQYLCRRNPSNRFVTLFFFRVDAQGDGLFINAGHNPAFVLRGAGKEVQSLLPGNTIVGAFTSATFTSSSLRLDAGDLLVVYSDGLTEAENPSGQMFGENRLRDLILEFGGEGAEQLQVRIKAALADFTQGHPQTDDVTWMLVEKTS